MKRYAKLFYFTVISLVLISVFVSVWAYPKSEPHPMNSKIYKVYYRGFDVAYLPAFNKRYYRVIAKCSGGWWEVNCGQQGYNKYHAYYENGTIMAEGDIYVSYHKGNKLPYPDHHMVRNAQYYSPDGKLVSSIINGSGVQKFYYSNGEIQWVLELKNYKRVESKMWAYNGKLVSHVMYLEDGTEKYLNEDGTEKHPHDKN